MKQALNVQPRKHTCFGVTHAGALQDVEAHVAQEAQVLRGTCYQYPVTQPIHQQGSNLAAACHDDVICRCTLCKTAAHMHKFLYHAG